MKTCDEEERHKLFANRLVNGRFRPGMSGNKKGRPSKARSTRAIFQEMLQSHVTMKIDGSIRRLTVIEAMAARVKLEALTGPLRGLEKGIFVAQQYSLDDPPKPERRYDFSLLTDEELEWYGRIAAKLTGVSFESLEAEADTPSADAEPTGCNEA